MTVIRPNSISGITSLTAHRGSIDFYAHDGSAATFNNINSNVTSGVSTFASLNITGDLDVGGALTYEDVTNIDSVGVITARAGVKVPDNQKVILGTGGDLEIFHDGSYSYIKDTGTGGLVINTDALYIKNASDTEAIAYSVQDSAVSLYFDNSKKFETTSSGVKVSGSFPDFIIHDTDTTNDNFRILHNSGGTQIQVDPNNVSSGSYLIAAIDGSEKLRITSAGNIGIGINNPAYELEVASSDTTTFNITAGGNTNLSRLFFSDDDAVARGYLNYDHQADSLLIGTAGSEKLRITDAGMLGINMTPSTTGNSTYMLQMYNAGSQCFMSLGQGSGNGPLNGLVMGVSSAAHYITGRENSPMIFATNDTERMRLDTSGRLLLNSGTDVRIELGTTGSTGTNNRNHLRGDGTNMKYNCCAGGGHFFEANGGERMRIDSGGRVNIGDAHLTQTSSYLHVGRSTGGTAAGESVIAATLGDYSTMVSAILTVKNAGNRGNQGNAGGSPLAKFEFNNGTAFEIDKNGYRTLPYQPCAMAYNAQGQHMAGGAVAQFNSTRFNIGGMYNSSNGRMTVPVDGRYLVAYSGLHDYISQNAIGFDIRINGSNFNGGEGYQEDTSSSNSQLSKTLILHLSANDYVEIYIRSSGTQVHQRYGSFSMCLLT